MSSQQQLGLVAPQGTLGEVDHVRFLSENLSSLLTSDSYQDITLIVECQRIPAHKIILASRSEYFRYSSCCDFHYLSFQIYLIDMSRYYLFKYAMCYLFF